MCQRLIIYPTDAGPIPAHGFHQETRQQLRQSMKELVLVTVFTERSIGRYLTLHIVKEKVQQAPTP